MVCGVFRATGKSCMAMEPAIHDRRARFLHAAVLGVTTSTRHRHDSAAEPPATLRAHKLGLRFGNAS